MFHCDAQTSSSGHALKITHTLVTLNLLCVFLLLISDLRSVLHFAPVVLVFVEKEHGSWNETLSGNFTSEICCL